MAQRRRIDQGERFQFLLVRDTGSVCDLERIWLGDEEGELCKLSMRKGKEVGLIWVFKKGYRVSLVA